MQIKSKSGRIFKLPSDAQDAVIRAGIAQDPDTREVSGAEFTQFRRPGRPVVATVRPMMSLRTDPDILAHLRASGKGWQTRVNALLREAVEQGKV